MIDTKHLRELLAKASPGPWAAETWYGADDGGWAARGPHHADECKSQECADDECGDDSDVQAAHAQADADLIAAARNALPALLDRLEALEAYVEMDDSALEVLQGDIDEHLPHYMLADGTGEPANYRERIEYAGQEIKRLQRELHRIACGETIDGDGMCPHELTVANQRQRIEALERVASAARAHHHQPCHAYYSALADALAALDEVTP